MRFAFRSPARVAAAILMLAAAGRVVAGDPGEVRLYTNADLDRFGALPDSAVSAERPTPAEWEQVTAYLRSAYERIEARQANELARRRTEAEIDWIEAEARPRSPYLPLNLGYVRAFDAVCRSDERAPVGLRGHGAFAVPAHPTPTRVAYRKATRLSGVAAFPSNSRAQAAPPALD